MDMAHYYHVHPCEISKINTYSLSVMLSAMISNRAIERIHRIEEIGSVYMKDKTREKFINGLFKQIDSDYADPHMVSEEELRGILGHV